MHILIRLFVPLIFSSALLLCVAYAHWAGFKLFFNGSSSIALMATLTLLFCGVSAFLFRFTCSEDRKLSQQYLWIADFFHAAYFMLGALNIFYLIYEMGHPDETIRVVVAILFAAVITFATILVFQILLITLCRFTGRKSPTPQEKPRKEKQKVHDKPVSPYGQAGYIAPKGKKEAQASKASQSSEQKEASGVSKSSDTSE